MNLKDNQLCEECGANIGSSDKFCQNCGSPIKKTNKSEKFSLMVLLKMKSSLRANEKAICDVNLINSSDLILSDVHVKARSDLFERDQEIHLVSLPPGEYKGKPLAFDVLPTLSGEYRIELEVGVSSDPQGIGQYDGEVRVEIGRSDDSSKSVHVDIKAERFVGVDMSGMIGWDRDKEKVDVIAKAEGEWKIVHLYPVKRVEFEYAKRAKLLVQEQGKTRTVFLIAKQEICFGMAKRERRKEIDLTLRLLPSRSRAKDPENWQKSAMISKLHGRLRVVGAKMQIMDSSRNGIFIRGETEADDLELVSLGEWAELYGTLDEDGSEERSLVRIAKGEWVTIPDHVNISLGQNILRLNIRAFHSQDSGNIGAVRISRVSNCQQHEYIHILDRIYIGHSEENAVCINDGNEETILGEIYVSKGQYHFRNFMRKGKVDIGGKLLSERSSCPLKPGDMIGIDQRSILFDSAQDNDFVNIS